MEKAYKILKLAIAGLAFAVILVGAYVLYQNLSAGVTPQTLAAQPSSESTEAALPAAPDFTVYDIDGAACTLSDFRGKPVILNFWASWCGPCQSEMPDFEEAYKTYGDQIQFLIINLTDGSRETVETASSFIAQKGYTFPVYYDTDISAAIAYAVSAIPMTCFIDANGSMVTYSRGALSAQALQKGIDMLLPSA